MSNLSATQTRPPRLKPGARIGVVSPAYWLEPERLARACGVFEHHGFELVPGESVALQEFRFAGTPEARADDINRMFADESIDAIICARGGYGGNRVLPLLDYELIRRNPKIFVGYSDITGLLTSISQRSGLVTFHGPMLTTWGTETHDYNLEHFCRVLAGDDEIKIYSSDGCPAHTLRAGTASGALWGGNLSLLTERLGTPDQLDTTGCILFIEEIDEKLYAFDRMMQQMKNSGSLDQIKGLIVGEMLEMGDTEIPFGKNINEIVLDVCSDLPIPIISNFPCGHGHLQATLPVSHPVEICAEGDDPFILIPQAPVT